jgi:hypothetical protein
MRLDNSARDAQTGEPSPPRNGEALILMGRIVGWDSSAAKIQGRTRQLGGRILRRTTEEEWRRRLEMPSLVTSPDCRWPEQEHVLQRAIAPLCNIPS